MSNWQHRLRFDPIAPLLASDSTAIHYFARRDLLGQPVGLIREVWELPETRKLIQKQKADGSWNYKGAKKGVYPAHHYSLIETWRRFRLLIDQYEFTREHPAARAAAEYLFSCQTDEGDIRGMIANQYATYYTGAILSLLIKAGYQDDPRVEKGMTWLLSMRQDDGGWSVPILTVDLPWAERIRLTGQYAEPIPLDQSGRARPSSHTATGMVLRAFAAHPRYRGTDEARRAANLLRTRFFQKDSYSSYQAASYWVKFDYPYWWNHLLAALDSVSMIELDENDEHVRQALDWFVENQQEDGLWKTSYAQTETKNEGSGDKRLWISLAICRVLKRFFA
jgi:hypothetical protein